MCCSHYHASMHGTVIHSTRNPMPRTPDTRTSCSDVVANTVSSTSVLVVTLVHSVHQVEQLMLYSRMYEPLIIANTSALTSNKLVMSI